MVAILDFKRQEATNITINLKSYNLYVAHIYTPEIPDPAPSWSQYGAQFGGLLVFPVIKIIMVVRCVSYLNVLQSEHEDNHTLKAARHAKIVIAFVLCLLLCVWGRQKNPKITQLSPMADDAITRDGIGSLVSLVYICDVAKNWGSWGLQRYLKSLEWILAILSSLLSL